MIVIDNVEKVKKDFKKLFSSAPENFLTLKIQIYDDKANITLVNDDAANRITYTINANLTNFSREKYICLCGVSPLDCIFDIIFSKNGFHIESYKNAYSEIETLSKLTGTRGYISQVIFKSKTKKRDFIQPCNQNFDIVDYRY